MKTATKWILGILIGLVVVAALAAIGFLVMGRWGSAGWMMESRAEQFWDGGRDAPWRAMPWRGLPGREMPMHPDGRATVLLFGGFSPLRMIAGSLIWLGLLILIVLGVITLVRGLRHPLRPAMASVPAASPASMYGSVSTLTPNQTCPNCQRPVQEDWNHCPNCGVALHDDPINETPQS